MTPARIALAERQLNPTMRKILNATPIQEAWTPHEIGGELLRTGKRVEVPMIVGCLNALKQEGLLKEPRSGCFMRVTATPTPTKEPDVANPIKPAPTPADPLNELEQLANEMMHLADKAEKVAEALRRRMAEVEKQVEKFKQFQELLKGMS